MSSESQTSKGDPRYLLIGEVLRPHGVRGELRVRALTDYPERVAKLETIYVGRSVDSADIAPHTIEHARLHQNYILIKLHGVNDRDEADAFRQLFVMVAIEDAVPLEAGEFYLYQVIGLRVENEQGEVLGEITDVLETGANDVYIIESPVYGEVLLPVIDQTIIKTDVPGGVVIVRIPPGLLPSS